MFDPVETQPYLAYNYTDKVNTPEHQALALDAARQVIFLFYVVFFMMGFFI
jgi:hypothetical protein